MDIKLVNGDIGISSSGEYSYVSAIDEALQRAVLCAQIPKGSFIYNKDLGTELADIDTASPLALKTAEMLISEALMGTTGFKVKVSSLTKTDGGKLKALLEVESSDDKRMAEVTLNADL